MKVAVIGSRTFKNYDLMARVLDQIHTMSKITLIISGGASGADSLSEVWADLNDVEKVIYVPEWDNINHPDAYVKINKYGHKYDANAGFRRNKLIIDDADVVIAFWDGKSIGTVDSVQYAKQKNKPVKVFVFDEKTQQIINQY